MLFTYRFHFFLWLCIEFPQQNINQSETGIGDNKLPVELYGVYFPESSSSEDVNMKQAFKAYLEPSRRSTM